MVTTLRSFEPSGLWSPMLDGVTQFAGRFASRSRYRVHSNLSALGHRSGSQFDTTRSVHLVGIQVR